MRGVVILPIAVKVLGDWAAAFGVWRTATPSNRKTTLVFTHLPLSSATHRDGNFIARTPDVMDPHRNRRPWRDSGRYAHIDLIQSGVAWSAPKPQNFGHPAAD